MSIDDRIGYIKRLVPIPLPPAPRAPPYVADGPTSIHQAVNIPPLFSYDGKLISGKDNPYDIVTSAGSALRGISHYAGFSLRVNWEPYGDFWDDDAELRLNYDKYYFMWILWIERIDQQRIPRAYPTCNALACQKRRPAHLSGNPAASNGSCKRIIANAHAG